MKRREMKGEGKRERYTQLNAELQKIAKRDKKAFLNEQYKEIQENNRMRKNGDLFKKIGEIKGTFHARMGTIKNRKSKALTEAEKIKTGKNTQKKYIKKALITQITMMMWSLT